MIGIIDYRLGNLGSIQNMLRKLGHASTITSDAAELRDCAGLILPGVGAFDNGMRSLRSLGLVEPLDELVRGAGRPVLGICLGAQLMTRRSEEGEEAGLGWVQADTVRFDRVRAPELRIPSMGWGDVTARHPHWLLEGMPEEPRFYFVHSFHFEVDDPADVLLEAHYGYDFAAAFAHGPVVGVQFHPEKSHKFGMFLLDRFARHVTAAPAAG